jgi:glycosyltransferase involved in cell wall biosynthesis
MKRLGVIATSLSGERPTGLGVYTREVLRHVPWPQDTVFVGEPDARRREWPTAPHVDTPRLPGLAHKLAWQALRLEPVTRAAGCELLYAPTHELAPNVGLPVAMVVHDLIPLLFPHLCSRKLSAFFRHLLPRACEKAAAIVAISEHTKRDLVAHYGLDPARITVVPNGYDHALFHPRPNEAIEAWRRKMGLGAFVLYVGRLSEPKNVGRIVEAFALASGRVPHELVIAGPDDQGDRARLEARARALGVGGRVRMLDYLSREDLPLAYGAASLFVTASLYEGFGLPPLEAMACGAPVLVSNASSLPEVVGEAGALFDPHDADALAARMVALLGDPARLAAMRAAGLERAARFSWTETGRRTWAVLERTLASI